MTTTTVVARATAMGSRITTDKSPWGQLPMSAPGAGGTSRLASGPLRSRPPCQPTPGRARRGRRELVPWAADAPVGAVSPAGLRLGHPDLPHPAPLGEGRGNVRCLWRRWRGWRNHWRLAHGAQPGPLDDLLRRRVRGEHDCALEDLAP